MGSQLAAQEMLGQGRGRHLFMPTPNARNLGLQWFWRDASEPWYNKDGSRAGAPTVNTILPHKWAPLQRV